MAFIRSEETELPLEPAVGLHRLKCFEPDFAIMPSSVSLFMTLLGSMISPSYQVKMVKP
jgi:hypothetical protein